MTGFRDMTFCSYWESCAVASFCHRPLTEEVKREAAKWWGSNDAPIAMFVEKPECHKEKT